LARGLPGATWKVPLIVLLGILNVIVMGVTLYFAAITPAVGPTTPLAFTFLAGVFLSGIVVYLIGYFYNKQRGLSLKMIYSEIPPE
jgi:uncharacterized membrane protein